MLFGLLSATYFCISNITEEYDVYDGDSVELDNDAGEEGYDDDDDDGDKLYRLRLEALMVVLSNSLLTTLCLSCLRGVISTLFR